jgi:hypothetical protein
MKLLEGQEADSIRALVTDVKFGPFSPSGWKSLGGRERSIPRFQSYMSRVTVLRSGLSRRSEERPDHQALCSGADSHGGVSADQYSSDNPWVGGRTGGNPRQAAEQSLGREWLDARPASRRSPRKANLLRPGSSCTVVPSSFITTTRSSEEANGFLHQTGV